MKRPMVGLPPSTWTEESLTIILRVPVLAMRPNGRSHWFAKAAAVKRARSQAKMITLNLLRGYEPPAAGGYSYRYYFHGVAWDDDNAIASPKAYLDGICDALRIDDKALRFRELIRGTDRQNPRIEIILHLKA